MKEPVPRWVAISRKHYGATLALLLVASLVFVVEARAQPASTNASASTNVSSMFRGEDRWLDISGFLEKQYGFLPLAIPITEPAVGYGVAGGLAFISTPLVSTTPGFGRPNITMVGGMGTQNGSRGFFAGDLRHWLDDHFQTLAGVVFASVNLDFHGIGRDRQLADHPLRYNLEPRGGMLQTKLRLGDSRFWAGLNYAYATTRINFDVPEGTPGLPEFRHDSVVGGLTPSLTFDSRDNFFTPTRGSYLEASVGYSARSWEEMTTFSGGA